MIAELEQHVRECWGEIAPGAPQPRRVQFLKLNAEDYPEPLSALVLLAIADRASQPVAVAKISRAPASDPTIRREAEQLELVHRSLPPELTRVVPRLVRSATVNGRPFILTPCLPGEIELHHTWGPRRALSCSARISSALRWARDVALASPSEPIGVGEWLRLESPGALSETLETWGWSTAELRALEERLSGMWGIRWPAGLSQGDFFPGNVLFERNTLSGVVDWGLSSARAPVFCDLLFYEAAFSLHAVNVGRIPDVEERRAVHGLPPFAEVRDSLRHLGVDVGFGGHASLAVLLAGVLSSRGMWGQRRRTSTRYIQLLRLHVQDFMNTRAPA